MLISIALNIVRRLTSEKTAANLASRLHNRVPRTRLDKWLVKGADYWLFYETGFETCSECFKYIIGSEEDATIHDDCKEARDDRLKEEDYWIRFEMSLDTPEDGLHDLEDDEDDEPDYDYLDEDDEPDDDYLDESDEADDDECQGGCGQPNHACSCAEMESHRRFQADPDTRGSWWTA